MFICCKVLVLCNDKEATMNRTLMARLLWLFQTRSRVLGQCSHYSSYHYIKDNSGRFFVLTGKCVLCILIRIASMRRF